MDTLDYNIVTYDDIVERIQNAIDNVLLDTNWIQARKTERGEYYDFFGGVGLEEKDVMKVEIGITNVDTL